MSAQPLNLYDIDAYTASKLGKIVANYAGDSKQVEYTFSVTDGPAVDTAAHVIPAGAVIESCDIIVEETLSGGTNFTLGTAADADGFDAAVTATTGYVSGDGALVGTALGVDSQLVYSGSRTAGVLKVIITYRV